MEVLEVKNITEIKISVDELNSRMERTELVSMKKQQLKMTQSKQQRICTHTASEVCGSITKYLIFMLSESQKKRK